VIEEDRLPAVELNHSRMVLRVRPGTDQEKKQAIVEQWYREQLKQAVPPLIAKWEPLIGVRVGRFFVQRMKTKWGSCNPRAHTIRLNTDLAKKPRECLEYVVVHEMVHLREPTHNARFIAMMDQFMPKLAVLPESAGPFAGKSRRLGLLKPLGCRGAAAGLWRRWRGVEAAAPFHQSQGTQQRDDRIAGDVLQRRRSGVGWSVASHGRNSRRPARASESRRMPQPSRRWQSRPPRYANGDRSARLTPMPTAGS